MQEQLKMLKPTTVEEQTVPELATPPALLPGPTSVVENIGGETRKEKKSRNKNKATKSADDTQMMFAKGQSLIACRIVSTVLP